jgi:hypothetical protein
MGAKKYVQLLGAIATIVVIGFVIHACVADQRRTDVRNAAMKMDEFIKDWDSDLQIASATSRIALAGPVMKLREREEELAKYKAPECLSKGKSALMAHVRASIESFTTFMADQELLSSYHMTEASKHLDSYSRLKSACENSLK